MVGYIVSHIDFVFVMAVTSLITFTVGKIKGKSSDFEAVKEGVQVLLASEIDRRYNEIIPRGCISRTERNIIGRLAVAYGAVKGNHGYEKMIAEMDALPTGCPASISNHRKDDEED